MNKHLLYVALLGLASVSILSARTVTLVNNTADAVKVKLRVRAEGDNGAVILGHIRQELAAGQRAQVALEKAKTCKKHYTDGRLIGEAIKNIKDISVERVRVVKVGNEVTTHKKQVKHDNGKKVHNGHEKRHHEQHPAKCTHHAQHHTKGTHCSPVAYCYSPWHKESIKYASVIEINAPKKGGDHCLIASANHAKATKGAKKVKTA
jgi:hypothetical protein